MSKDDIFWLAFILVLIDPPGLLFNINDTAHNFRIINIGTRWIEFYELFFLTLVLKTIVFKPKRVNYFYMKALYPVIFMSFFLLLYGLAGGMASSKILKVVRSIFPFVLLFYLPRFIKSFESYRLFFRYISFFIFFVLAVQLFELVFRVNLANYFGGTIDIALEDKGPARQVYSVFVILIATYGILHAKSVNQKILPGVWDDVAMLVGFVSLTLNATRGYWLGMVLMIIGYFIFTQKLKLSKVLPIAIVALIFIVLITQIPQIKTQIYKATTRLNTLTALAEGDYTAEGTLSRITDRTPRVLNKFAERPIFGWGFTDTFFEYADVHVAHPTILLNSGIIGYLIWLFFWLYYLFRNIIQYLGLKSSNPFRRSLLVNILGFLAILIVGSTSTTVFSYLIGPMAFYLSFIFGLAGLTLKKAYYFEHLIFIRQKHNQKSNL